MRGACVPCARECVCTVYVAWDMECACSEWCFWTWPSCDKKWSKWLIPPNKVFIKPSFREIFQVVRHIRNHFVEAGPMSPMYVALCTRCGLNTLHSAMWACEDKKACSPLEKERRYRYGMRQPTMPLALERRQPALLLLCHRRRRTRPHFGKSHLCQST